MIDRLTGLKNRTFFHKTFGELGTFDDDRYKTMAVFDIDHFKAANDLIDGDKAVRDVVRIALEEIGEFGELMRWGGDEFLAVLYFEPDEAVTRMRNLVRRIENETYVTISIGVVRIKPEDIFKVNYYRAVQNCYIVKEMGGNGVKL